MSSNKVKGIMCIIFIGVLLCADEYVRKNGRRLCRQYKKSFFQKFYKALIIAFIVLIRTDGKFKFNKRICLNCCLGQYSVQWEFCVTSMQ